MTFPETMSGGNPYEWKGDADSSAGTSHTLEVSRVRAGGLIIVLIGVDGTTTVTWPTGYSVLTSQANSTVQMELGYRVVPAGGEDKYETWTTSGSVYLVSLAISVEGHDSGTPPEVATVATGTSALPNSGSLTPSWGSADTMWGSCFVKGTQAGTVATWPTSYTYLQIERGGGTPGDGIKLAMALRQLAATSEDPARFGITPSDDWVAQTFGIKPGTDGLGKNSRLPLLGVR